MRVATDSIRGIRHDKKKNTIKWLVKDNSLDLSTLT